MDFKRNTTELPVLITLKYITRAMYSVSGRVEKPNNRTLSIARRAMVQILSKPNRTLTLPPETYPVIEETVEAQTFF